MIKKNILPVLLFGLILLGCEKDNENRLTEIKIGDYRNMIINKYDTLLTQDYSSKYFNLDLDNDGIFDIQFKNIFESSIALQFDQRLIIACLDSNVQILGYHVVDTLFLNRYTNTSLLSDNYYVRNIYFIYTCHRIDNNDSIVQITTPFKISVLEENDPIRKTDTFKSFAYVLKRNGYSIPSFIGNEGDTTIWKIGQYRNDCNIFPTDNYKFIGFLLNGERLGWFKIRVFENYDMLIYESAIQK